MNQVERARLCRAQLKRYGALRQAVAAGEEARLAAIEKAAYGQAAGAERVKASALPKPTEQGALMAYGVEQSMEGARRWVVAIQDAWSELLSYSPERAEILERYFQLNEDGWDYGRVAQAQAKVCEKYSISQAGFYRRLNEAVETVVFHAARHGCFAQQKAPEGPGPKGEL